MKPPSTLVQQRKVDEFNSRCVVGQPVNVRMDNGEIRTTKTRSDAQMLGGHTAVVWLEGIAGAYLLDRVTPLESDEQRRERLARGDKAIVWRA